MKFTATLGIVAWTSVLCPCLHCLSTRATSYVYEPFARGHLPWRPATAEVYGKACAACEVVVVMTAHHWGALIPLLRCDKSVVGSRGRALVEDYVFSLQLRKGERLKPCEVVRDVGGFENLAKFPLP